MRQVSTANRLGYELLWLCRMLARREDILFGAEMRLERRIMREFERATEGQSNERKEIPSVRAEDFRTDAFNQLYKDKSPLVIRGLGTDTKAAREWSPDLFADKYGETMVDVRDSPKERVGTTVSYNEADFVPTRLRDYVHEMRHGQSQQYLGAMSELFKHHPELMDDLEIEQLNARIGVKVIRPEIFMGTPRNHTP